MSTYLTVCKHTLNFYVFGRLINAFTGLSLWPYSTSSKAALTVPEPALHVPDKI